MAKELATEPRLPVDAPDAYETRWLDNIPYWGVHAVAIGGVAYSGWSWTGFVICLVAFFVRMFGITGAYHRYFSHRTYKTSRPFQFFLGLLGTTAVQKGPLWWAAHHRKHHKYSDTDDDVHSLRKGFYWSHQGWILVNKYSTTDVEWVKDLNKFPELRWLNRLQIIPPVLMAVLLFVFGGWTALLWGFFVSTMLLWHGTFTINSFAHLIGKRRYETGDDSRNNWFLALLTMGEGWHNNHHYYQRSTAQGFYWWEIDVTYYILKMLSWVGLVWDLHTPSEKVREDPRKRLDGGRKKYRTDADSTAPVPLARSVE